MKVQSVEIVNFKGISELSVSPNGCNVYVVGSNGVGKSSFLDAVFKVLTGKNLPSKLTKDGERKGKVKVDLGSVVVEAAFDSKKEKVNLTVSAPEGGKYDAPRTMLDALVGTVDFDVSGFLSLTPRKQVEQLKAMLGLDLSDLDKEYKRTFEERAESNRELKFLEANSKPYKHDKTTRIDVTQLEVKRMEQMQSNATRKAKERELGIISSDIESSTKRLEELKKEMARIDMYITEMVNVQMDVETWLDNNPHTPDDEVVAAINEAREHNAQVEHTEKELAHREAIKAEEKKNANLCNLLADIEEQKAERIRAVKMPVEGLSFTDDGLLLDGLPFEDGQVNTARQIVAGLQICSMMHKDVKIARFDGSLLDKANLAHVEEWAASQGIQLFVELVSREETDGLQIIISEK